MSPGRVKSKNIMSWVSVEANNCLLNLDTIRLAALVSNNDRTYTPPPANAVIPNKPNATGTVSNEAVSGFWVASSAASIT